MYRKASSSPTPPDSFELPFEGKLSQDNRWVIMANLIPWDEFEEESKKKVQPQKKKRQEKAQIKGN